jgi:hypothetical protein
VIANETGKTNARKHRKSVADALRAPSLGPSGAAGP